MGCESNYTRSSYFPQGPSNLFISLRSGKTHAAYALSQWLKNREKYLFWVAAPINIQLRFNLHYMHQPGYLSNFNKSFDQTPTPTFILLDILLMYQSTAGSSLKMVHAFKINVAVRHYTSLPSTFSFNYIFSATETLDSFLQGLLGTLIIFCYSVMLILYSHKFSLVYCSFQLISATNQPDGADNIRVSWDTPNSSVWHSLLMRWLWHKQPKHLRRSHNRLAVFLSLSSCLQRCGVKTFLGLFADQWWWTVVCWYDSS